MSVSVVGSVLLYFCSNKVMKWRYILVGCPLWSMVWPIFRSVLGNDTGHTASNPDSVKPKLIDVTQLALIQTIQTIHQDITRPVGKGE